MPNPLVGDLLNISLHEKQLEIFHDSHRFKAIACGRRFGKTKGTARVIVLKALSKPDMVVWVIAPTFPQTMYIWREVKRLIPKKFIRDIKEGEKFIELINGSTIWAKSGDNPDGLVGEGLDLCVIDEAARCKEEVWKVIRPALMDKLGECWFLSTPVGKNWFYQIYLRERKQPKLYKSFNFTSYDNPLLSKDEIKSLEEEFSDEISYKQEILAQFIDNGGIVFRNLKKCLGAEESGPLPGHFYIAGIDLGKLQDFTVITVADTATNTIVHMERFNKLDWTYQKEKIKDVVKRYNNACVVLDTTGLGDTVYDDLSNAGVSIEPFHFTNISKNLVISNLMRTMDNGLLHLPEDIDLIQEFESFEYEITDKGNVTYNAPKGMHDDIVISVALCTWGLQNSVVSAVGRPDDTFHLTKKKSDYVEDDMSNYDDPNDDYGEDEEVHHQPNVVRSAQLM